GDSFDFPDDPEISASAFSGFGWTVESHDINGQPVAPAHWTVDPSVYYLESIRWFSMHNNTVTEFLLNQPSGFWHFIHLGFTMQPEGRIDMIAAVAGDLPNQSGSLSAVPPHLPWVGTFIGRWVFEISGPQCPWARPY